MVSKKKSDWPPPGWKVQIKVSYNGRNYKCYINSKTGEKFYSKLALLRYIKDGSVDNQESQSQTTKEHAKMNSGKKQMQLLEANDSLDLPPGWTIEWRTRKSGSKKGTKYKCFIDPSTGCKFYSEPEVYRYLKSTKGNAGSSRKTERGRIRHSSGNRSVDALSVHKSNLKKKVPEISKPNVQKRLSSRKLKVVVERTSDEELPSGWIKEMRIKHRGDKAIRRDPFYIDPVTGLVFRSKPEVLRYLETGEISKHAYRRKNISINEKESLAEKAPPTSSSNIEKPRKSFSRKHLLADEASPKQTAGNTEVQSKRSKRSSSKVGSASACEASLEQIALLPEPVKTAEEKVPAKPSTEEVSAIKAIEGVTELALPKVQVADEKENDATLKEVEPSAFSKHKSEDVRLQGWSVGKTQISKGKIKDKKVSSLPSRSSKRLAGVEAEVVFDSIPIEHARLSIKRNSSKTNGIPRLELIPSESQESARALDDDLQNVPTSQQEKTRAFDVDTPTVLPTQLDSVKKNGSLSQENGKKVILQEEQAPPRFSQYSKAEISQIMIDQLFEDPADTMPESKIDKFPGEHKIPEVQPDTLSGSKIDKASGDCPVLEAPTASLERDSEQPGSQFCFPSPLWSDPCLEFAFKTLTGAIPLDDNVAIQDYIQHQIRTSEQSNNNRSPDIAMPSFCQNDETKLVPPLPEDVSFTKSNGFSSHKSSR